jgi:hypothetical protein
LALAAYIVVMPIAVLAASEIWWGNMFCFHRAAFTVLWPICLAAIWCAMVVYFPAAWLRAGVFCTFKPLHTKGLLPKWAVRSINVVLKALPE